jgi:phenylacetate-CoA ligase
LNNPAITGAEYLSLSDLKQLQSERWACQSHYLNEQSAFYRHMLGSSKIPSKLEAIGSLPFTDKNMLRQDQQENPAFGSYLAAEESILSRVHRTSGTTGTAMNLALSAQDALMTAAVAGRAQTASGLGPQHRVVHCLNYQLWMGGYTDHAGLEATGATVIPFGVGNGLQLIQVIQELGINAISCTPSYPAVLEQTLSNHYADLKPQDLGLQLGLFGGEPGLDESAFRQRLESTWGFKARNSNYGVTDVLCNFAGQTDVCDDLHFLALDVLYPELIDPESNVIKPWREGEQGELVLTHLAKECQPLVRFKTGDIIILTGTDKATCGRTAPRFRVIGRSDDMVVVRGINVFPTMITGILNKFTELSGHWRMTLDRPPPYHALPLQIELARKLTDTAALSNSIVQNIKQQIGCTAEITLTDPASIPRSEGKTRYVTRTWQ